MSCKKYILKKDMKAFIIRDKQNSPVIGNSPIRKIRNMMNPSIILPPSKRKENVAKSLQTLNYTKKNKNKSLIKKNLEMSLPHPLPRQSMYSNIRYLFQNFEDDENENKLQTPNDSLKIHQDSLKEKIDLEYQMYLEATKNQGFLKLRNLTPQFRTGTRVEKKFDVDSPREIRCFWKSKKIF